MAINKSHPNYSQYIEKCKALYATYDKQDEAERAKYPQPRGQDHPAGAQLKKIYGRYCEELKKLQEEYAYLFVDDPETEAEERKRGKG